MKHLLLVLLALLLAAAALAGEPPTAPMLRIETGFHTAVITRIATDSQGRWIATASHDKTLRLWEAKDGSLLRAFRLPSGAGNEGKLYAAAMDPAGEWLAAGGWSKLGYEGFGNHNIYILDRASGQLRQRIEGLENVINHLCVSPDGRWLAAALFGGQGLRVYDAKQGFRPVFADRDYGKDSYGCAFSPDSRSLVSTCLDGGRGRLPQRAAGRSPRRQGAVQHRLPPGRRPDCSRLQRQHGSHDRGCGAADQALCRRHEWH
ncbi:WD40 repeat domain-containing protein [Candidatus Electronema sp. JM]|uniref:WD40 repeat domain-containing protein n=1 Tax=Candidatus Electronema sp. JM TaxID=3401571 RepID=UPI003AA96702